MQIGVSAILHTDDPNITILDSTANFGNILARENEAQILQIHLDFQYQIPVPSIMFYLSYI